MLPAYVMSCHAVHAYDKAPTLSLRQMNQMRHGQKSYMSRVFHHDGYKIYWVKVLQVSWISDTASHVSTGHL